MKKLLLLPLALFLAFLGLGAAIGAVQDGDVYMGVIGALFFLGAYWAVNKAFAPHHPAPLQAPPGKTWE